MMKSVLFSLGVVGLAGLMAGCEPELAQLQPGTDESNWQNILKESYPSWKPPRIAPPAIQDNMDKSYYEKEAEKAAAQESADSAAPAEAAADPVAGETAAPEAVADTPAAPAENPAAGPVVNAGEGAGETEYTVVSGDSLSLIAKKVYKDGRLYNKILKANRESLNNNPNLLRPGMKLKIPAE